MGGELRPYPTEGPLPSVPPFAFGGILAKKRLPKPCMPKPPWDQISFGETRIKRVEKVSELRGPYGHEENLRDPKPGEETNVVISKLPNGRHAFCIDIDHNCELVQSKTPGHYHLYIDIEIEEKSYFDMLDAMAQAGVVEHGYARMSRKHKASVLRLPGRVQRARKEYDRIMQELGKA